MSFLIKINVKKNVPQMDAQTRRYAEAGVKEIADHTFVKLLAKTPVKTGRLRSGYQKLVSGLTARIISTISYIMAVEKGTRPHIITAKSARALHFLIGGQDVFAKSVQHPGTAGKFFIRQTVQEVNVDAPKIMARHLNKVGKGS